MPKSTKRKKEKEADFTKAKLKLGKGKKAASNAVDTTFKARSIVLPQQSIVTGKETAPTTKRGLTLDDLLSQLKHYSPGVRKDAIHGLNELLDQHMNLVEQHLLKLVNACARLIGDEDALVRKALHSFLSWLLVHASRDSLSPHISVLLVFTSSAMTHIFPEIRIDAIRVLDLLLDHFPQLVAGDVLDDRIDGGGQQHGRKILDGYLNLLSVNSRLYEEDKNRASTSSAAIGQTISMVSLSIASKTDILKSFSKFLTCAASDERLDDENRHEAPIPLWFMKSSFTSEDAYKAYINILITDRSTRYTQPPRGWKGDENPTDPYGCLIDYAPLSRAVEDGNLNMADIQQAAVDVQQFLDSEGDWTNEWGSGSTLLTKLCRTLQPVLISLILDCAPAVFSPTLSSSDAEEELLLAAMEITRCLYGQLLRDGNLPQDQKVSVSQDLMALLSHTTVYFPFGENRVVAIDGKTERIFEQMNYIYCELFSLHSISTNGSTEVASLKHSNRKHKRRNVSSTEHSAGISVDKQSGRVRDYIVRCLRGQAAPGASGSNRPLGQALSVQSYTSLLPSLWWLLNKPHDKSNDASEVFLAILEHATKCGSNSSTKAAATEFIARIILAQSEMSFVGMLCLDSGGLDDKDLHDALRAWVLHLPKVLWEVGDKSPLTSELIMLFLLRSTQRCPWLFNEETLNSLCSRFQPFFTMQHATRGELRGPYHRLDYSTEKAFVSAQPVAKITPSFVFSPLKKLALDVAAAMVSTPLFRAPFSASAFSTNQNRNTASGHRVTGNPPVSRLGFGRGLGSASGNTPNLAVTLDGNSQTTRTALRAAVDKAVVGTSEADYWHGILAALVPTPKIQQTSPVNLPK